MKLRLGAQLVAFVLAGLMSTDRLRAQVDDCIAQLDSCIESAAIPDEARENVRLLDEVWQVMDRGRELGEAYLTEEVGLQREGAVTLAEYALWARSAMDAYEDMLQAHYCALLEPITTGPELNALYQDGWDWEQRKIREVHRLATGVFAILSERDSALLLAHLNELMLEPRGISGSAPLLDIETWSPERVARIKWIACEMDE